MGFVQLLCTPHFGDLLVVLDAVLANVDLSGGHTKVGGVGGGGRGLVGGGGGGWLGVRGGGLVWTGAEN